MYEGPAVALMPHGPEGTMIRLSLLWDFMHFVALGPQKKGGTTSDLYALPCVRHRSGAERFSSSK